jgi:ATP-dependent helicase HrpB
MQYPVFDILPAIREKLSQNRLLILQAPPGAGKSTVLPLELLDEPWLKGSNIIMLEPRRLAARAVAMRMSEVRHEQVGETIGYRVRFENRVSKTTRLEVVTEGILTRMLQNDNALEGIGLIIFDEFHERSLHADLALALALQVQQVLRDDLRILIMSATLDGEALASLLKAPIVTSTGRQFPVSFHYQPQTVKEHVSVMVAGGIRKAIKENEGDILAFLPGAGEIIRTADLLTMQNLPVVIYPLYGDLNFKKQQEAILPSPTGIRKVVLATSIAETSLTIEGVSIVVDGGYSRVPKFDPRSGFTRLETTRVTKDAADQRAGRAGRLGPGTCYRMWTSSVQSSLIPNRIPEILEADLAPLILELRNWGIQNMSDLTWITPPPPGAVSQAQQLLQELGAIHDDGITDRGKEMLRLPTHPRIAHMLLEAKAVNAGTNRDLALAADIAALLEERDPLQKDAGADLSLRIEVLRRWRKGDEVSAEIFLLDRIERLAFSWRKLFNIPVDNSPVSDTEVGKWIMSAYPERVARQIDKYSERYKMSNGRIAKLPEHDPLHREPWLAIAQVDAGISEGKIFLAAPVTEQDLVLLAEEREIVTWDESRDMVSATREMRLGSVVLSSKPLKEIPKEKRIALICNIVREKGLSILNWGQDHTTWQARVLSLKQWRPDETWPNVSEEYLLETVEEWLAPFLGDSYKRSELQRLDPQMLLSAILPWDLQTRFEQLAPSRLLVPSGSLIKLSYFTDGRPPVMEVRLQEVFGLLETPTVNEGRNKVIMHLLSPGYKPVQVTQDLRSFWNSAYREVRKELRSRYPKHSWPDDPFTAQPVRGPRKKF